MVSIAGRKPCPNWKRPPIPNRLRHGKTLSQNLFCQGGQCYVLKNGELLYFDGSHLSLPGLALMVPPLADIIADIAKNPPG